VRITIITIGSRGDMQPYLALSIGLKAAGYQVRLATHAEYAPFIRSYGIDFAPLSGNPLEAMQSEEGKQWLESSSNPVLFLRRMKRIAEPLLWQIADDTLAASEDADVLIGSTLGLFTARDVAEQLHIPVIPAPLQPVHRTRYVANSTFPPPPDWMPLQGAYNRLTYTVARQMMWQLFGNITNEIREARQLPRLSPRKWIYDGTTPILYGYSKHVIPVPPDWNAMARVCGYWFLDAPANFAPSPALADFLQAGPPPVYVGFGSMNNRDPQATTELVLKALQLSGQRGIVFGGWGGLSSADLPDNVFQIDSTPHDWLFPRMAAVVHHGGAGTTAAGLRAGVPSIVVPFFADQPFWADRVRKLGVGPTPISRKRLTADNLADAIREAVGSEDIRARAAALGERIRDEDGVANAVEALGELLPVLA
jgi:sterol 3beta-glucosyltransferase